MESSDLNIARIITSPLPLEARNLNLTQGEQIRAVIVSTAPSGMLQINLKGILLTAESKIGQFQVGQVLSATVDQTTPQVVLRIAPADIVTSHPLQQFSPKAVIGFPDLHIPRIIPSLLLQNERTLTLAQGEQIRARVVTTGTHGTLQTNPNGRLLNAPPNIGPFQSGQTISAAVDHAAPQGVLRLAATSFKSIAGDAESKIGQLKAGQMISPKVEQTTPQQVLRLTPTDTVTRQPLQQYPMKAAMGFSDLNITRIITSLLPPEARTLNLTQGEQIRAVVVSTAPNGMLQINLKGTLLTAESKIGQFQAGQILSATVDQTTPQVVLRLAPTGAFAGHPPPGWLTALLSPPAPLHTVMNSLSRTLNHRAIPDALSSHILGMLKPLMSTSTLKPNAFTSASLRALINTLGYRYEPWLKQQLVERGAPLDPTLVRQQNLKANLMRLVQRISAHTAQLAQTEAAPLFKQITDMLVHIERTQVMNSMHAENGQPLTIEIPIQFGHAPSFAQLQFWQQPGESNAPEEARQFFVLLLELDSLGPVRVESELRDKFLSLSIRVTKPEILTIATRLIPTLSGALSHRGFIVKSATCTLCSVAEATHLSDQRPAQWPRLIDISV